MRSISSLVRSVPLPQRIGLRESRLLVGFCSTRSSQSCMARVNALPIVRPSRTSSDLNSRKTSSSTSFTLSCIGLQYYLSCLYLNSTSSAPIPSAIPLKTLRAADPRRAASESGARLALPFEHARDPEEREARDHGEDHGEREDAGTEHELRCCVQEQAHCEREHDVRGHVRGRAAALAQ